MARAATTSDAFNAIAEPRRRAILALLCGAERAVNEVVDELALDQPSVSKHLRVLREVDLVRVRRDGRRRLYSANPEALEPVSDFVRDLERFWDRNLDRLKVLAERRSRKDEKE